MNLKISQLYSYPVKSLRGLKLQESKLTVRGLEFDRNWMIVDETGTFVSQRSQPAMALLSANLQNKQLILTDSNDGQISVDFSTDHKPELQVEIWGDRCEAFDEGDDVANWLTQRLDTDESETYRLVRIRDSFQRPVDPEFLKDEEAHTAFADGFPFLVTNERSLDELNQNLIETGAEPVTMDRFRPNIVIDGLPSYQENEIHTLTSGDERYSLGLRKPCKRCKVTTVDQITGAIKNPKEPLRTLTRMKTIPESRGAYFGMNSILTSGTGETIRVGDPLHIRS
ncbi:MOSC domain-containing protein [Rhodohalobacter sp. SW132]|uniref:MOSC domain-containing protein n=1 Tax=Rhodohalobacter sp. SW132 TaxID=2293433 RepID=UPI000E244B5E|nr:MOSC N-terminal beta barrel domain-containing protein [Rhodohalobacter sp. SW132]REL39229.1 MOSC domain-containing protein [Rhodohalobacter sp. SW132]